MPVLAKQSVHAAINKSGTYSSTARNEVRGAKFAKSVKVNFQAITGSRRGGKGRRKSCCLADAATC